MNCLFFFSSLLNITSFLTVCWLVIVLYILQMPHELQKTNKQTHETTLKTKFVRPAFKFGTHSEIMKSCDPYLVELK